jgi:hypothetical protein
MRFILQPASVRGVAIRLKKRPRFQKARLTVRVAESIERKRHKIEMACKALERRLKGEGSELLHWAHPINAERRLGLRAARAGPPRAFHAERKRLALALSTLVPRRGR